MPQDTSGSPPTPLYLIERGQTLSGSMLWQIQREFYQQQSIDAWRNHLIPNYVTTNPVIAKAYARMVIAYLRDWLRGGEPFDPSQPVYILELGSGPGSFAFYFLRSLSRLLKNSPFPDVRITYVMTDFSARNLDFWKSHPMLQRWVETGQLTFSIFDAARDEGISLGFETSHNPLVVIANYCLDSLPTDAFHIVGGSLQESRLEIRAQQPYASVQEALDDENVLSKLELTLIDTPLEEGPYQDADFNRILHGYAARLPNTRLLFPIAALRCLHLLDRLSGGRLLMLVGDKGFSDEEDLVGQPVPGLTLHAGSFSLMVNFHSLGEYVRGLQGRYLSPPFRETNLVICAYLLGSPEGGYIETAAAYEDHLAVGGPYDTFLLMSLAERQLETANLLDILAILRMSGFDRVVFKRCHPFLIKLLEKPRSEARQEVSMAVQAVLENNYDLNEGDELSLDVSQVLYQIRYFREAIKVLQIRQSTGPPSAGVCYNLALCFNELQDLKEACRYLDQSLEIDPNFEPARNLRFTLGAEANRLSRHTLLGS